MAIPESLPKILTEAEWNKKKGTLAKMAGETGIGANLKKLEAAFKLEPNLYKIAEYSGAFAAYPEKLKKDMGEDRLKVMHATAKAEFPKVIAIHTELKELVDLTTAVETKFRKNKLIPDASRKVVTDIKTAATNLVKEYKVTDLEKAWQDARNQYTRSYNAKTVSRETRDARRQDYDNAAKFNRELDDWGRDLLKLMPTGTAKSTEFQNLKTKGAMVLRDLADIYKRSGTPAHLVYVADELVPLGKQMGVFPKSAQAALDLQAEIKRVVKAAPQLK